VWRRLLILVVLLAGLVAAVAVAASVLDGTVFDDPPDSYATYRGDGLTFRHPPGWQVTRAGQRVTVAPPARSDGGPLIVLTRVRAHDPRRAASDAAHRLVRGVPIGLTEYEIDVPRAVSYDVVGKRRNGESWRATAVAVPRGDSTYVLTARDEADGPRDARIIAGTLRVAG
jgi:hypothetical protein